MQEKSYLEINISNIKNNLEKIKEKLKINSLHDIDIAPVIKANAYGLGTENLKDLFEEEKIDTVVVATIYEAKKLREEGYKQKIITLNELLPYETEEILKYDLVPGVSDFNVSKKLNKYAKSYKKKVKVHIEVDTGMGRVGEAPSKIIKFVEDVSKLENIEVEGIYSHFSSADVDKEYTKMQLEIFNKVIKELEEKEYNIKYKHISASTGIFNVDNKEFNMVRPGIIVYGYMPDENMKDTIGLKPSTRLISHVVFIKEVDEGTSISYGRTYITNRKTKIATIPLGYADGIRRLLSNKGRVYINGKYAPIIGRVCMDNFMVDVTGIDVNVGDEVIIWDNKNITIEEIAKKCETINYEILCGIANRVKRIVIK